MQHTTERFTSRWGILLATIGMAVGTGNIWRFPRIAAQNGGGEFLIPWVIFLFLWAIPLLLAEFALGKSSRRGPAAAIGAATGARHNWMGLFIGLVTTFITFYYSVVTGWCLKYFVSSSLGDLQGADPQTFWETFTSHPSQPVVFHGLALVIGSFIIFRGVAAGIERANRYLIPTLFALLLLAAVRAVTLPGAAEGLRFLFVPDLGALADYRIWLAALTQAAWSTGAGWGLVTVLGAYVADGQGFVKTGITAAIANNFASLLAGIAVICTVFALSTSTVRHPGGARGEQRGTDLPLASPALPQHARREHPPAAVLPHALLRRHLLPHHPARTGEPDGDGYGRPPPPIRSHGGYGRFRDGAALRLLPRFLSQPGLGVGSSAAVVRTLRRHHRDSPRSAPVP